MAFVLFGSNGYEYLDAGQYNLFSSDKSHNTLYEYVTKDLSRLPELLEQYFSKKMDITNFEIREYHNSDEEINTIKDILISAHPYYKFEYRKVIINAIYTYFNELLVHCYDNRSIPNYPFQKNWYMERITHIIPSSLVQNGNYPDGLSPFDSCDKYSEWINGKNIDFTEIEENFILNFPHKMPLGFYEEIHTQKTISNMLHLILDISEPELAQLTINQRAWMYSQISQMAYSQSEYWIPTQYSFSPPPTFREGDRSLEMEQARKIANIFEPLYSLGNINIGRDGVPVDKKNAFSSAIELAKTQTATEIFTQYKIESLRQLLYLEIIAMINNGTMIRKCKRCGKYFVVNNRKIAYCDRLNEAGSRCSAIGSQQNFKKKLEDDEPLKIYNRAYKTHFARVKKGTMSKDAFRLWYDEAKSKLAEVRNGNLDISDFQTWLKK